jgi:hypothetical protein
LESKYGCVAGIGASAENFLFPSLIRACCAPDPVLNCSNFFFGFKEGPCISFVVYNARETSMTAAADDAREQLFGKRAQAREALLSSGHCRLLYFAMRATWRSAAAVLPGAF